MHKAIPFKVEAFGDKAVIRIPVWVTIANRVIEDTLEIPYAEFEVVEANKEDDRPWVLCKDRRRPEVVGLVEWAWSSDGFKCRCGPISTEVGDWPFISSLGGYATHWRRA